MFLFGFKLPKGFTGPQTENSFIPWSKVTSHIIYLMVTGFLVCTIPPCVLLSGGLVFVCVFHWFCWTTLLMNLQFPNIVSFEMISLHYTIQIQRKISLQKFAVKSVSIWAVLVQSFFTHSAKVFLLILVSLYILPKRYSIEYFLEEYKMRFFILEWENIKTLIMRFVLPETKLSFHLCK